LARRLAGSGVTANALHPGVVATRIYRSQNRLVNVAAMRVMPVFALSPEKGARTSVYLASSPEVASVSGQYFVKCKPKRSWKTSYDEAAQERLWAISEQLTGLG
jgi:NAD(P)-dependent dehydrogenase (short-subunit alcohol dehydrogenase family)